MSFFPLGSGLTVYIQNDGLPQPIAQSDFSQQMDLREKRYMQTFQSRVSVQLEQGAVGLNGATAAFVSGSLSCRPCLSAW